MPCTTEYFYKNSKNKKDGLYPECKKCSYAKALKWQYDNYDHWKRSVVKRDSKPERKVKKRKSSELQRLQGKQKEWQQNNPAKINSYSKDKYKSLHRISSQEWEDCKAYFAHRCAYCGLEIENHWVMRKGKLINMDFHKEHVIHDGRIDLKNCVPACQSCNDKKWKFTLNEWYNPNNPIYTYERYFKIYQWLRYDYKKYITKRKPKQKYIKKII